MRTFSRFIFDSYRFDPPTGVIELNYSLDDSLHFQETITLPLSFRQNLIPPTVLSAALEMLHLIGGVSYYKAFCPPEIALRNHALTSDQAAFWDLVYERGLGEFFYRNDLDFRGLIHFPVTPTFAPDRSAFVATTPPTSHLGRVLVPFGGGKDSIVSLELIRTTGADITLFRMGHHPFIDDLAAASGLPLLTVQRKLDPQLLDLNARGALNGHVPITAYIYCLLVVVGLLYDFDTVAMSNERSASDGNLSVPFHGALINHQWSKSEEFETAFQRYVSRYLVRAPRFVNPLRSASELAIARLFSTYTQYHSLATSCNVNWRIGDRAELSHGRWCRRCPKCAFAFSLLAAFMPLSHTAKIFGGNLYEDSSLLPLYRQLLGLADFKPFECVGTSEETWAAFYLALKQLTGTIDPPALRMFRAEARTRVTDPDSLVDSLLAATPTLTT